MEENLYTDETYKLIGMGYTVYNNLKFGYQEKYYQRAYALELDQSGYRYRQESKVRIVYKEKIIGRYFLDFLVNDRIVVELKVASDFHPKHVAQVLGYLKAKNLRIGIILLFTKKGLRVKRVIN